MSVPSVDRGVLLDELTARIAGAWESFDRPRGTEPGLEDAVGLRATEDLPEEGSDLVAALDDAVGLLEASVAPGRPLFAAYIGSTGLEVGLAGSALAAAYDVNLASSAGGAELVEEQALAWVGELIGVPHRRGAFTSGGMTSNLSALLAARERALPGTRTRGFDGRRAAVYCSAEAHESVVRAVETIGLGSDALRRIPIDEDRRMDPAALEAALAEDREVGVVALAVVATAGTTLTGAVDPVAEIADLCAEHGTWLHVDGAYGLPAAGCPQVGSLFAGIERADSLTLDAHKWLGMQKSCSVVLLRDEAALDAAFGHRARYMLRADGRANPVDRTLEYSRPLRSLKLWLALRVHGAAAFRAWIAQTLDLAAELTARVEAAEDLELLHRPMLSTVCFRHLPAEPTRADDHNRRLAESLRTDGRVYVAPAELDGQTCLRVTLVNFRTTASDVEALVAVVREVGARLDAAA